MASTLRECAPQRRVLVCADESELGELARRWAGARAAELGATLVTLHGSPATPAVTLEPAHATDLLVLGLADSEGRVADTAPELVAAAPCLAVLMRPGGGDTQAPVTVAVSGDPSDEAVIAAAVSLAAPWHATMHLLHSRPLPLRRSDSPEEEQAGCAVLESARRRLLRFAPRCTPSLELVRLPAQEAVGRHCSRNVLVLGARRSHYGCGLGLVTRAALNYARCPVVVVPNRRVAGTDHAPDAGQRFGGERRAWAGWELAVQDRGQPLTVRDTGSVTTEPGPDGTVRLGC